MPDHARPCQTIQLTRHPLTDFPTVKPSAVIFGTAFTHIASLAILAPVFGETYKRAQAANSKEEFLKSKEAASSAVAWGTSLAGSALQTYGVAALLNSTGTLSYRGAAAVGTLVFLASSAPSVSLFPPPSKMRSSTCQSGTNISNIKNID